VLSSERPEKISWDMQKTYKNISDYMQCVILLFDISDKWSLDLCMLWSFFVARIFC